MNTAQTTSTSQASATPLPIDWDRILSLEPTMKKAAAHLARISGEDRDELFSAISAKVAETAAVKPQFLANTDSYIVTFAYRRVISDYRKARANDAFHRSDGDEDDAETMIADTGDTDEPQIGPKLARFVESLDVRCREVLAAMWKAGDLALKENGRVNIAAVAQFMGKPDQTINYRVGKMRADWNAALVAA